MRRYSIRVGPLPDWLDVRRLLGPTLSDPEGKRWHLESGFAIGELDTDLAADLAARLRKLAIDGRNVDGAIQPELSRTTVRAGRLAEARRLRDTTPGFEREGVQVDEEGHWSLTPEALALTMAEPAEGRVVIDAGCGVGGNTIGFARAGARVIAIDNSAERLAMARHNAEIYAVSDRIQFVEGDAIELAAAHLVPGAILFVDPPWGLDWADRELGLPEFPLLVAMSELATRTHTELWAKLPASFPVAEIGGVASAVFGEAPGDMRRIKFVLVRRPG